MKEPGQRATRRTTSPDPDAKESAGRLEAWFRPGVIEHTPYPNEMRDHLANVRTFLAWVRTAITIMAFGFVVAKFGLLLRELPGAQRHITELHFSSAIGVVLVLMGAVFLALSMGDFLVVRRQIERQRIAFSTAIHILLAAILIMVAVVLAVYLTLTA